MKHGQYGYVELVNEKENRMYCKNCGAELNDRAVICPRCGVPQVEFQQQYQQQYQHQYQQPQPQAVDNGGFGWGLLGCCIPIVGLILFLVWKDTKPKTARAAGKGALVCVILTVLLYVIDIALGIGAGTLSSIV